MRNKIVVILFVLVFASLSHAGFHGSSFRDFLGPFRNFTMGAMIGVGPTTFVDCESVYYADSTTLGYIFSLRMAFPLSEQVAVVTDVGVDKWNFRSRYDYLHRPVIDAINTLSVEFAVLCEAFLSEHFFMGVGPVIRIPFINERVTLDDRDVFTGKPSYASNLWLNIDVALGVKYGPIEFGIRTGYEVLGFFKETERYKMLNLHEIRLRFYASYWFCFWDRDKR
ncbi:hypothetical protein J5681_06610 [bacterium]|nr:hypothetical protein [bacterium]